MHRILRETHGSLVFVLAHTVDSHHRDGSIDALRQVRQRFTWSRHTSPDDGCSAAMLKAPSVVSKCSTIEIVNHSDTAEGFQLIQRQSLVERLVAWLGGYPASPEAGKRPWPHHKHGHIFRSF